MTLTKPIFHKNSQILNEITYRSTVPNFIQIY
jgi:hypothetical protein